MQQYTDFICFPFLTANQIADEDDFGDFLGVPSQPQTHSDSSQSQTASHSSPPNQQTASVSTGSGPQKIVTPAPPQQQEEKKGRDICSQFDSFVYAFR